MTARVPLLERDGELATAGALVDRAGAGEGGLLVVEGPPGAGKTRLLREIAGLASDRALTVLAGRGSELEREFAFGLVRQALETELSDALFAGSASAARPVFGSGTERGDRFAVLNGLFWLLANVAERNPAVVVLDDVHWADEPSLRFLEFVRGRLDTIPALVVLGARPPSGDAAEAVLAPLASGGDATVLRLRNLGTVAVARMVEAHLGPAPHPAFVSACLAASGGNPFLLVDLLRELHARGLRPVRELAPEVAGVNPANVARSVAGRLARAGDDAEALALALATVGDGAPAPLVAELAGLDTDRARLAADALASAGLIAADPPLRFEHALLRTAAAARRTPGRRARLHEAAARALERNGAPPERVATHLLETEPGGDAGSARLLAEAGREAVRRGAPELGVHLLARSLAEPPAAEDRLGVLDALGRAEADVGAPEARDHLHEVVATARDPEQGARALLALVWSLGPRAEELAMLRPDLERSIAAVKDRELRLELEFARIAVLFLSPGHTEQFGAACDAFRHLAGDTAGECAVLAWVARRVSMQPGATVGDAGKYIERALRHPSPQPLWTLQMMLALLTAELYDRAEILLADAIEGAIERGSASAFASASSQRALVRVCTGDLLAAEADARAAIDSAGMAASYPFQALIPLVQALADQGRPDEAAALLADAGYDGELPAARPFTALLISRGSMHAAAGEHARAAADLEEALRRLGAAAAHGVVGLDGRLGAAEAFRAIGDEARAVEIAEPALAAARAWGGRRALGGALRVAGLLRGGEDGLALLKEAVDTLAASPARLWHARALVDLGAALRRSNRRRDAREPLRAGLAIAEECGAESLARAARGELGATGARVRPRAGTGVDELTPSERRIVEMAAGGLANAAIAQRLFVTVKTVEMHLTSAYRKLGVGSRAELAHVLTTASR